MAEWKHKRPLRREVKEVKENENKKTEATSDSSKWVRIRLFPIWLRILIVLAILAVAMVLGVMIGYGVIGDGEPADALKWRTWQHIIDIMSGRK
ncbi:DNA-directed RNA polymerase subunit beta [Planomicrobium soli]|uniref:DNA-directed RNA polymerase subunit beta n=1 Tax=Planomicrobium soli TaxID=1176648 RepID=A0A2P8H370_9BACL|nr:DNA-directed RNA polymerase subunit beta [Planomicrobium soli]PSL40640.1 DNA-directed RNA polymerase subunit beta [Planomicrobium soli]